MPRKPFWTEERIVLAMRAWQQKQWDVADVYRMAAYGRT